MFIQDNQQRWPVRLQCSVLRVSASGYYAWRDRQAHASVAMSEDPLTIELKSLHKLHERRLGARRMQSELAKKGFQVGIYRVRKRMRELELVCLRTSRQRTQTTDSSQTRSAKPNTLNREFDVATPNTVWATDITYINYRGSFLYLAVVLDLFARRVIGYSVAQSMHTELVLEAIEQAWIARGCPRNVLVHSDRGSQYSARSAEELIETRMQAVQSMSRKGNCWDNAVMESFFSTLKLEYLNHWNFSSLKQFKLGLWEYIDAYYNRIRPHSTLGNVSPEEFEANYFNTKLSTK